MIDDSITLFETNWMGWRERWELCPAYLNRDILILGLIRRQITIPISRLNTAFCDYAERSHWFDVGVVLIALGIIAWGCDCLFAIPWLRVRSYNALVVGFVSILAGRSKERYFAIGGTPPVYISFKRNNQNDARRFAAQVVSQISAAQRINGNSKNEGIKYEA